MAETEKQNQERALRELEGKNIAQYAALFQSFLDTRVEKDKTLVTSAAAGVGLLVTILTTVGVTHLWELSLYLGSAIGFLSAIWTTLKIFDVNATHLERVIRGVESASPELDRHDKRASQGFIVGAIFFVAVAVAAAIDQFNVKNTKSVESSDCPDRIHSDHAELNIGPLQTRRDLNGEIKPESIDGAGGPRLEGPQLPAATPETPQTTHTAPPASDEVTRPPSSDRNE